MDMKILAGAVVVLVAVLVVVLIANPMPENDSELSYAEIALDDPNCSGGLCIEEYMLVSTGDIFKKTQESDDSVKVEVRNIEDTEAVTLIDEISKSHGDGTSLNEDIAQYHFYTTLGGLKKSYCSVGVCDSLFSRLKSRYDNADRTDGFFIQLVYWKVGDDIDDYHIFSDGAVIHSKFTPKTELLSSNVYSLDSRIVQDIDTKVRGLESSVGECKSDEFVYGYLLVYDGAKSVMIDTCGSGDGDADALFNYLKENV